MSKNWPYQRTHIFTTYVIDKILKCYRVISIKSLLCFLQIIEKMADESYGKELAEEVNKLAKEDLREDDLLKKQSLDRMREWLAKSSEIKFCRDGNHISSTSLMNNRKPCGDYIVHNNAQFF